nr:uncharacterized protein LOC113719126 isoform X1 [Coffea arabica]XP_027100006.1 uncharacterized protein LOC113719126 isoform X1 [Coffea arabica]
MDETIMEVEVAEKRQCTSTSSSWQLKRGPYLGEVSALCFLHLPSTNAAHLSPPLPLLLAGTGSEILVYDLSSAHILASFQVFDGTRVHGITLDPHHNPNHSHDAFFNLAVYGERRVKFYSLQITNARLPQLHKQPPPRPAAAASSCHLQPTLLHSLSKFAHWVLDVCFLNKNAATSSNQGGYWLAIGCTDNSVWFWDIFAYTLVSQVTCPDRCLLYSMRMWGSDVESLRVASGTIYNEIIVWKLDFQNHSPVVSSPAEDQTHSVMDKGVQICGQLYQAVNICRLTGHEGSIFRIAWLPGGSKLLSVSDDRSARVWLVNDRGDGFCGAQEVADDFVGLVLFGHSARVWDCCIFDNLIVTAGEDCTCRVWGPDGIQLKVIKEHIGRGVWRCLYDPISSLIITAGFDSSLKVYQMHASSSESPKGRTCCREDFIDRKELFSFLVPNSSGHIGLMDSKSEYVRCLHFSREDSLYVATNNGYLHHMLFNTGEVKWTELVSGDEGAPIICMDLLSNRSSLHGGVEDWVAVGNGKGSMRIVHVVGDIRSPKVEHTLVWSAEIERQLLGTYWCKSLGFRFIFTADPSGTLKLWRLCDSFSSISHSIKRTENACLIATYISCFCSRIMCLDASSEDEVLVCGDIRGNILLYPLSKSTLFGPSVSSEAKTSPMSYFKGAHGISTVCSISITTNSGQVDICTTGQDGCICYLEYDKTFLGLEFTGMKSLKELSAVRSVSKSGNSNHHLEGEDYAIGFASSDFIIWNLTAQTKVVKVACGGWHRPHSYYIGDIPETNNCFAFVKNDMICIHRHWVPQNESELYPRNLHLQFHGREIHSVCFIGESDYGSDKRSGMLSTTDWIATGCEDGTVRLTRYEPGFKNWSTSKLLGEHVGGSAVRSLCCVSRTHKILLDLTNMPIKELRLDEAVEDPEDPCLLISVGAKRVLTVWKRKSRTRNKREALCGEPENRDENGLHGSSPSAISSLSFHWLSTDMPTKDRNHERKQNIENVKESTRNACITSKIATSGALNFYNHGKRASVGGIGDKSEDDWRYLAVTAFLVKVADSRISVCFVVVASSDATVTLRALLLPCRIWFDVVILSTLSPVLALQHIIVSKNLPFDDNSFIGSLYMVISGSTDGSIAFWDLTKDVEDFMHQVSSLQIKDYIDCQRRPRTGRGSQGGRWWRGLGSHVLKKKPGDEHILGSRIQKGKNDNGSLSVRTTEKSEENMGNDAVYGTSEMPYSEQHTRARIQKGKNDNGSLSVRTTEKSEENMENDAVYGTSEMPYSKQHTRAHFQVRDCAFVSEEKIFDSPRGIRKVSPLHVLYNAHQSGVNCLYVSNKKSMGISGNRYTYYVLSGGDDQALNCVVFDLTLKTKSETCQDSYETQSSTLPEIVEYCNTCQIQNSLIRFLSVEKIESAHCSAVKGVWTDGIWVFSTGLDQRVRCWILDQHFKLVEHGHIIVSVPEPEAIDAQACGRNYYQITVAGRGMQMVEFFASS